MTLAAVLHRHIALSGPMTVAEFMRYALTHPKYGYYTRSKPVLGREGDFVTAPEISQTFGELIGLWCAAGWENMQRPDTLHLVELGPGRGTLMSDLLRATDGVPGFRDAVHVHFVEISPFFQEQQQEKVKEAHWHQSLQSLPEDGPMIFVANEFFDSLPVHQFQKTPEGWRERLVQSDSEGGFHFVLEKHRSPREALIPQTSDPISLGSVFEVNVLGLTFITSIAEKILQQGGMALIVDYGHDVTQAGAETLQAVSAHHYHDVLKNVGQVDLTTHVDFTYLCRAAEEAGVRTHGPVTQGDFLKRLGISQRQDRLCSIASEQQKQVIESGVQRLVAKNQMGELFKVVALTPPDLPIPDGFDA